MVGLYLNVLRAERATTTHKLDSKKMMTWFRRPESSSALLTFLFGMEIEHKKAGITGAKYLNPVARPLRMVVIKQMAVTHKRRSDRLHPMILTEATGITRTVRK